MTSPVALQVTLEPGQPAPLGATLDDNGCNFALYCPDAEQVLLCLFDPDTEEQLACLPLPAKTGKFWHGYVAGLNEHYLYAYRVEGPYQPELGLFFDKQKLLIDPYAKALSRVCEWDEQRYQGDSQFMLPKGRILPPALGKSRPPKPAILPGQRVIYEAHVKGLSQLHPDVPEAHRGKFSGLCHQSILAHLSGLGVTSVQLMPIAAFMSEPHLQQKGLVNYWGYNPVNFFSPDPRYGVSDALAECKQMVDALHQAGLEVIVDVVLNHTAEAGADGPCLSFRGLHNNSFYRFEGNEYGGVDYHHYVNHSGCGNTVNSAHPYVQALLMDALRYWLNDIGVDGFRFDLAVCLARDPVEFAATAALLRCIRQDPVLGQAVLIAEPWDIGSGGYRLGQFPSIWHECNDKYRDTVRAFWRGDSGMVGEFATRLMGSRDIFHKGRRSIHSSVNYVTYHDGFTLTDLVSFAERHNQANGEQNRDGHGHNLSCNYGTEGLDADDSVLALREQQKRNLFATLLLSQGTPHLLGGDELGRSQQGNNNAYCQDNALSWFDWTPSRAKSDFLAFCQRVIALRHSSQLLQGLLLADDSYHLHCNVADIRWYRPDGLNKAVQDWRDPQNQAFAVELQGTGEAMQEHWLLVFNAFTKDVHFQLPCLLGQAPWQLVLDTRYANPGQMPNTRLTHGVTQVARSVAVFRATDSA